MKQKLKKSLHGITLLLTLCCLKATAQSTVYFFMPNIGGDILESSLKMNGTTICDMLGPVKKTIQPKGIIKIHITRYHDCYRKCIINEQGKVLFSYIMRFHNPTKPEELREWAGEIQFNLSGGDIHYVEICGKGLNDLQLIELEEKDALKKLKNKKYQELLEYVQKPAE